MLHIAMTKINWYFHNFILGKGTAKAVDWMAESCAI